MRQTKKQMFLQEVKQELDTIKEKATKTEIGNLNFDRFNHNSVSNCIYGQMTGDCDSPRAKELYPKKYDDVWDESIAVVGEINRSFKSQSMREGTYLTALEKYLYMTTRNKHNEVIKYLKGEINEIKL